MIKHTITSTLIGTGSSSTAVLVFQMWRHFDHSGVTSIIMILAALALGYGCFRLGMEVKE